MQVHAFLWQQMGASGEDQVSPLLKKILIGVGIYYLKAIAFSLVSYLLLFAVYGGVRISLLAWFVVVILVFTIIYIPFFVRSVRAAKASRERLGAESK